MQTYNEKYAVTDDEEKLFRCLEDGDNLNVNDNLLESARNRDAKALCKIGEIYFSRGDLKSLRRAFQWYQMASRQNDAGAQYLLGSCYMNAWGIPRADHQLAHYMFSLAGSQEHPESLYKIGFIFHYGLGRPQDYAQAKELYQKAVSFNVARAEYNLGVIYECGLGVNKDFSVAASCYEKSAAKGFFLAKACFKRIKEKKELLACFKPKKRFNHDMDAIKILENSAQNSAATMDSPEVIGTLQDLGYRLDRSNPLVDIDLVIMVLELANRNKFAVNVNKDNDK